MSLACCIALIAGAGSLAGEAAPRRIALSYDRALVDADFPSPAVRVTIGGRTAWLLIDTGAGIHLLATWFANATSLPVDEAFGDAVKGRDSTGREMRFRGVRNVVATLQDGSTVSIPVAGVTDFPAEFESAGIAGTLNPQLLAGRGLAAALDLRVPEVRFEPFSDASRRLEARPLPRSRTKVCGLLSGPVPYLLHAVEARAGRARGFLLIDTGAGTTDLSADSPLVRGVRLEAGGEGTGITGVPKPYSTARALRLGFAGQSATVDARVSGGHGRECGSDGLLGLDALRRCAIVLGEKQVALACRP